jgi:hypothetical protein
MYSIDAVRARPAAGAVSGAAGVPDPAIGGVLSPQCATFTGMIPVFGVLLILFEWYW